MANTCRNQTLVSNNRVGIFRSYSRMIAGIKNWFEITDLETRHGLKIKKRVAIPGTKLSVGLEYAIG